MILFSGLLGRITVMWCFGMTTDSESLVRIEMPRVSTRLKLQIASG
jgi:hypothetical protein